MVRSGRSIRRLIYLVVFAFFWPNLWGEDAHQSRRDVFLSHPWRLPKEVFYLFDWLANRISRFLHPRPKIAFLGYSETA